MCPVRFQLTICLGAAAPKSSRSLVTTGCLLVGRLANFQNPMGAETQRTVSTIKKCYPPACMTLALRPEESWNAQTG